MAKKNTSSKKSSTKSAPAKASAPSKRPLATSPVRNSAVPKLATMPGRSSTMSSGSNGGSKQVITQEMIAKRAYEIYRSGKGGSQQENWLRAERELRGH